MATVVRIDPGSLVTVLRYNRVRFVNVLNGAVVCRRPNIAGTASTGCKLANGDDPLRNLNMLFQWFSNVGNRSVFIWGKAMGGPLLRNFRKTF